MLQGSCPESPLPDREAWQASLQGRKELDMTEVTLREQMQDTFGLRQLRPRES